MSTTAATATATPTKAAQAGTSAPIAKPRLRLTTRGRVVLTSLAAAPLVIAAFVIALNGGGAIATLEGSDQPFAYVTVERGETLWSIAESIAPDADPRDVIEQLVQLNRLDSTELAAGEQLAIPAQLASSAEVGRP